MKETVIKTDVLVIGGGIAGMMAAISAAESGSKVVIAEKANTQRSGAGSTGNDHFRCYIPEFHGPDMEPVVQEVMQSQVGWNRPYSYVKAWLARTLEIIQLWDSWGIPMKHDGKWEFSGHAFPGRPFTTLKYAGQNQKPVLTREAAKRGIQIVNRVMIFDLLADEKGVFGVVGLNTRDEEIIIFSSKSTVLATGDCVRLYPSPTPAWMFNRADPPCSTGDGRAMAYRIGAELSNMEIPKRWAGPRYFSRCGKATWIGVYRDPEDKPIGPFVTKPERKYGDAIGDVYPTLYEDYHRQGKGPVYMDCRGISESDYEYMMFGLTNEGNTAMVNYMKNEGIDIRKNPVEFMTYEMTTRGGVHYNERGETSVNGLYAAGDEFFGGISNASTLGWIAGENAAKHCTGIDLREESTVLKTASALVQKVRRIACRRSGISWQEANIALQQVMFDYAGTVRTASLAEAGKNHLARLKEKIAGNLAAANQHELMHCIEVLNLAEIAEIVMAAVNERRETRGKFSRVDFPFTNPTLNHKTLICRKGETDPVFEWREVK